MAAVCSGIQRLLITFLRRQQQFGNHVPIDTAQPFVGKKGAGTTGEGAMVESCFKQI